MAGQSFTAKGFPGSAHLDILIYMSFFLKVNCPALPETGVLSVWPEQQEGWCEQLRVGRRAGGRSGRSGRPLDQ